MAEEKFVTIKENKIRYLEDGHSDHTVVLVHGLGASAERWEHVIPYLKKKFHLIIPDLIGYGYSDKPDVDYTIEFFEKFLSEFLETVGVTKSTIIGSSLGAQIAAECVINQNNSIQKLVLVAPSGINPKTSTASDAYGMAALYPDYQNVQNAFEMMAGKNKKVESHIIEDFVKRMKMPNAKLAFISTLLGLKNVNALAERLHKISIPTLVIWGSQDPVITFRYAKTFVTSIKECQFVEMDGCGHTPFTEEPEKFSKIVTEFIEH